MHKTQAYQAIEVDDGGTIASLLKGFTLTASVAMRMENCLDQCIIHRSLNVMKTFFGTNEESI